MPSAGSRPCADDDREEGKEKMNNRTNATNRANTSNRTNTTNRTNFSPDKSELWTNIQGLCRVKTSSFSDFLVSQTSLYKKLDDQPFYFNIAVKFVNCPKLPEGTALIDIKSGFMANDTYYSKKLKDYVEVLSLVVTDYEVVE